MKGEPRKPERAERRIDWMAEFSDEEPHELRDRDDEHAAADEDAGLPRLIPLESAEPPLVAAVPPPHRPRPNQRRWRMPESVVVGIAMVVIFAALIASAAVWSRTEEIVDRDGLLAGVPEPPPIDPTPPLTLAPLRDPPRPSQSDSAATSASVAAAAPEAVEPTETAAIRTVLDRYRLAFNGLSVKAPLERQTIEFDACRIEISGVQAEASCNGRATFARGTGGGTPRIESRIWIFRLLHDREGWIIDRVQPR